MVETFLIVAAAVAVYSIIKWWSNRNWELYSSTFGYENYFKVITKLQQQGITYKTNTPLGGYGNRDSFGDNTQYDIYIKKGNQGRA